MYFKMQINRLSKLTFVTLTVVNIFFVFLFIKYIHGSGNNEIVNISKSSFHNRADFQPAATYLFIIRSDYRNNHSRNYIRRYWKNECVSNFSLGCEVKHNGRSKFGSISRKELLFAIEDNTNTRKYNLTQKRIDNHDEVWIPNSGSESESIKSLQFLTSLSGYLNVQFYIISRDTTFVNFNNVMQLLEKRGKRIYLGNSFLKIKTTVKYTKNNHI